MGSALLAGVSGLKAHQRMLDVAGNNLANVNTMGFKSSRVTFSELLSETLREGSQPTGATGGTNPLQIGSGAGLASVDRVMSQGGLVNTGRDLDMAIEGAGYFVLNNGQRDVYTRVGAFAVDSNNYLVDPGTGYRVQRIGYAGVAEGFQSATDSSISIPYAMTLPAKPTESITFSGNLSADVASSTTNLLSSGLLYTAGGAPVSDSTKLTDLDQITGLADGDQIGITGFNKAGAAVNSSYTVVDASADTLGDLLGAISTAYSGSTAKIVNGQLQLEDDIAGYSKTDMLLSYSGAGAFELPKYFRVLTPGSEGMQNIEVETFDSQGIGHVMSASFVKTSTANTWDLLMTSMTGEVVVLDDRRISGITFLTDGSYGGMGGATPDAQSFTVTFANDPGTPRTLTMDFGTIGENDGVTLTGGNTTVSARGQDGYASGQLNAMTVSREGTMMGLFTNGVRKEIADIKMATFQNPAGLTALGNNYMAASSNSGDPVPTTALGGGAGAVRSGSLEESNVEIAGEFVNLIQAQNGFQANARTIRVSNEILKELSSLIR